MTTKRIIWHEGAKYHVTVRGNRKDKIFMDEQDFRVYLSMLEDNLIYYSASNYKLVAYCLMTNHVHLIIETDKEPLTRFMSRINSMYTKYFNKKYNYVGHLFQGTYFSDIIKNDAQILEVSRYVHLNPVKAQIVDFPNKYKWSSYSMFTGEKREKLINREIILSYFQYKKRFELYKEFVERDESSANLLHPTGPENFQVQDVI